MIAPFA